MAAVGPTAGADYFLSIYQPAGGQWGFVGFPGFSFGEDQPFGANPTFGKVKVYDDAYAGPASGVHLTNIFGIPVLPLIPGVAQTTDFFRDTLPDLIAGELRAQGMQPVLVAIGEYDEGPSFGIDQVGYEYYIVVEGTQAASLPNTIIGWILDILRNGINSTLSIFTGGGGQGDVVRRAGAQPFAILIPIVITAAIIALLAAVILIPKLADNFANAIGKISQALWSGITGGTGNKGLVPELTDQAVTLFAVGIAGFFLMNYLLAKTPGTSATSIQGAKAATGAGLEAANIPIRSLEASTPLVQSTYGMFTAPFARAPVTINQGRGRR